VWQATAIAASNKLAFLREVSSYFFLRVTERETGYFSRPDTLRANHPPIVPDTIIWRRVFGTGADELLHQL
jgi:hypothetical protein